MAKRQSTKITINVANGLLQQVDDYAKTLNISRTAGISVLLSKALNDSKAVSDLGELLNIYKKDVNEA